MKTLLLLFLLLTSWTIVSVAQNVELDSMKKLLITHSNDTGKVFTLLRISNYYFDSNPDTALRYAQQAIELSQNIKYKLGEGQANNIIANIFFTTGNYPKALETQFNLLKIWQSTNDTFNIAASYNTIALVYSEQEDYKKALLYYFKATQTFAALGYDEYVATVLLNIGDNYDRMNKLDSALFYEKKAYDLATRVQDAEDMGMILTNLGNIQYKLHNNDSALKYYTSATFTAFQNNDKLALSEAQYGIAKVYKAVNLIDSSISHAKQSLDAAIESSDSKGLDSASTLLSDLFESKNETDSAFFYYKKAMRVKNELSTTEGIRKVQVMSTAEQMRQLIETEKAYRDKMKTHILIGGLVALLVIAFILFRSNRHKHMANKKIEHAYQELKSTQAQLIQSEKMASLGELTAGIAHEIQNPLNFVNNFSEVNNEMLDELQTELKAGNIDEAFNISDDIKGNEEKINFHGKRADAIVKAMLQHSRQTKGTKEPTDVNVLCDEYLRLSYHGLRAKDKDFNAEIKTGFDDSIGKINIVQQDIARALLNIFNNAFYAVYEKKKNADENYKPTVTVTTSKNNQSGAKHAKIVISDNGTGIPKAVADKIFQPFFTTKPTGQGTGLGLSLAYDIITKEHGGTIHVESNEGEGTKFIVSIPLV